MPATGYPYAVIHYHRDDGDYGSLEAGDYWGVHTWGEALAPDQEQDLWEAPIPFVGESDFGRFAYFRLADSGAPLNFIIHMPSGDEVPQTREPGGDRSFVPNEHPEVWIVQGDETVYTSQAEAQGYITVHYAREDADYDSVTLDAAVDNEPLATGVQPEGTDAYGAVFTLSQANYETLDFSRPLSLTVNVGSVADFSVTFTPAQGRASVYLQQGDATAYRSRAAAENVAVLHYRRDDGDDGDYGSPDFGDFWGLHVWAGAADPTEWQEPIRASGEDAFGVFFTVPLEPGAGELAYIIHRGDAKDPGPDQFLDLSAHGHEVWQESGADPEQPYLLPIPGEGAAYRPAGE